MSKRAGSRASDAKRCRINAIKKKHCWVYCVHVDRYAIDSVSVVRMIINYFGVENLLYLGVNRPNIHQLNI